MDIPAFALRVAHLELRSERVLLRRFEEQDLPIALQHELDPRIMRYVRDLPTVEEAKERVAKLRAPYGGAEGEWFGLAVVPHDVGSMIGLLGTRVVSAPYATVEIGYRLHPDHHRRGLASESCRLLIDFLFDVAGVRKVTALCVPENVASYRLMEKLGMRREGQLRQYSTIAGHWHDELVYGLFADERAPGSTSARTR